MRPTRPDKSDPARSPSGQHRISGTLYPEDWEEEVETARWRRERPTRRNGQRSESSSTREQGSDKPGMGGDKPRRGSSTSRRRPSKFGTFARGLSGSLAVGFAVLAVGLIGVQFWSTDNGQEGPGIGRLVTHIVVAVVALLLQAIADRRRDGAGGLATFGAVACVVGTIWFWWWL